MKKVWIEINVRDLQHITTAMKEIAKRVKEGENSGGVQMIEGEAMFTLEYVEKSIHHDVIQLNGETHKIFRSSMDD